MGRRIPSPEANNSIHPSLTLPLSAACVAATIAIIAALCISHQRKPPSPKLPPPPQPQPSSPASNKSVDKNEAAATPPETAEASPRAPSTAIHEEQEQRQSSSTQEEEKLVVDVTHGPIEPVQVVTVSGSRRKLSMDLSLRLPEGLSKIRTSRKERQEKEKAAAPQQEESVWMKTIILGERCKVPSEEDEVVVVDEKGNRQRLYHPRTPRSTPVSPTNSFMSVEVPTG